MGQLPHSDAVKRNFPWLLGSPTRRLHVAVSMNPPSLPPTQRVGNQPTDPSGGFPAQKAATYVRSPGSTNRHISAVIPPPPQPRPCANPPPPRAALLISPRYSHCPTERWAERRRHGATAAPAGAEVLSPGRVSPRARGQAQDAGLLGPKPPARTWAERPYCGPDPGDPCLCHILMLPPPPPPSHCPPAPTPATVVPNALSVVVVDGRGQETTDGRTDSGGGWGKRGPRVQMPDRLRGRCWRGSAGMGQGGGRRGGVPAGPLSQPPHNIVEAMAWGVCTLCFNGSWERRATFTTTLWW